jgi:hypothetical protein
MARSTTFGDMIIASNSDRSAIAPHSLVWKAFCAQSYCGSLPTNSCAKNSVICVCLASSSAPKIAMFRQPGFSPNRAIFSSPMMAAASTSETPPKCILVEDFQPSSRFSKALDRCSAALTAYAAVSFSCWVATYSG